MRQRLLMIRLSAVGDVANVLPSLALLRHALPEAHIAFAVEDRAAELILGHPLVDEAIVFPRRRWRGWLARPLRWPSLVREVAAYVRRLRGAGFDVALDFQGNLKGAMHSLASGAGRRIGFARGHEREGSHWFANEHVSPPADRPHRVEKFASLVAPLGARGGQLEYVLPPSGAARARVDAYLSRARLARSDDQTLPGRGRFIVLHPGTSDRGAAKRWPPERFAALARRAESELGCRSIVTWGPGEEELARAVVQLSEGAADLAPRTESLLDLVELVGRAAAFVSADTGPMHLAAARGTPCVALFGPKDPAVYHPWGEGHIVVRAPLRDGLRSMGDIGVAEVFEAVVARLERTVARAPAPGSSGTAGRPSHAGPV